MTTETTEQTIDTTTDAQCEQAKTTQEAQTDELTQRIEALQAEVKAAKEAAARANAESYNAQRRMEQETDKAKKFALQKFAKEMLEVVDNLERAIGAAENAGDQAMLEGIELTHKSLLSVLEKNGVQVVNPIGEKFNPDYHEAVGMLPDTEKDVVGQVLQKGYTLNDRTLRPAIVMVGG